MCVRGIKKRVAIVPTFSIFKLQPHNGYQINSWKVTQLSSVIYFFDWLVKNGRNLCTCLFGILFFSLPSCSTRPSPPDFSKQPGGKKGARCLFGWWKLNLFAKNWLAKQTCGILWRKITNKVHKILSPSNVEYFFIPLYQFWAKSNFFGLRTCLSGKWPANYGHNDWTSINNVRKQAII